MAKAKTPKAPKEQLTLADNPSLIQAGEEIHLRVFDDFFIEEGLPKWKQFRLDWDNFKKQLKVESSWTEDLDRAIKKLEDPKVQEEYKKRLESYKKSKQKLDDDKWHIREKHEKSVEESIKKTVRLSAPPSFKDKVLTKLGLKKQAVPVEVAFEDLKDHLLHTTTKEMAQKKVILDAAEKKFRDLGQYNKANQIKAYASQIIEEQALIDAGFTTYVTEQMMIDFISKSERGVMVDFLRYYEGVIPDEVAELKKKADATMIFDNYVVAHYADLKKVAKKVEKKEKAAVAKKEIERRRDPILFGIIKESRKLFFIADWVTDVDDLTLQVMEEALGQKGIKLDDPTVEDPSLVTEQGGVTIGDELVTNTNEMTAQIRRMVEREVDHQMIYNSYSENFDDPAPRSIFYRSTTSDTAGGSTTSSAT